MINILKKIWQKRWIFRSIFSSIYFNFHYLPIRQAIKLPIILYKPKLLSCKGKIIIKGNIKPAMITLGKYSVSIYPNSGIIYENHGGQIIFDGNCFIGNNSAISIGSHGYLAFGNNFAATTSLKIISYHHIEFKNNNLCGWDCLFLDTDFHQLTPLNSTEKPPKAYSPIIIGENNWFALKCTVLKGTRLADNNIIAAYSLLNRDYSENSYCLLAGSPAKIKKTGIYRNPLKDKILYHDEF